MVAVRLPGEAKTSDVLAALREHGYAVVERRADGALMDRLRAEVEPHAERLERLRLSFFGGGLKKVEGLVTKSPTYVELLADPLLHELAAAVVGAQPVINGTAVFFLEQGGRDQTLHCDENHYRPDLPRGGERQWLLNFMWAVTEFSEANGATRIVRGSHRWPDGRVPSEADPVDRIAMPKGSFTTWLGSTFHGAGINRSPAVRIGAQMSFNPGYLRSHEAHLLLVPPTVARDLPLVVQEALGYRAYRGMVGCIEQQSPLERLGLVDTPWANRRPGDGVPDPHEVEAAVRAWFARSGGEMPTAVALELRQLAETNAARRDAPTRTEAEVFDTVAFAQARFLMNHLVAAGLGDLVEQLERAPGGEGG